MSRKSQSRALVLMIHGLGAWRGAFAPLLRELRDHEASFELVALDLWGFGGSALPTSVARVSIPAFADQVAAELRRHGDRELHLVGHSMGGAVAVELHRRHPSLAIESFVNLEGNLTAEDCGVSLDVSRQEREAFCRNRFEIFKRVVRRSARSGEDLASVDWIEGLDRTSAEVFYDASVDLVRVSPELYPVYLAWKTRKVYVFGERTLESARVTHDRLVADGMRVEIVPGAGHVMQVERPAEVARICRGIWAGV